MAPEQSARPKGYRRNIPCAEIAYDTRLEHAWFYVGSASDSTSANQELEQHHNPAVDRSYLTEAALDNLSKHTHPQNVDQTSKNDGGFLVATLVPETISPNFITLLGAVHCLVAFVVTWSHLPNTLYFTADNSGTNVQTIPLYVYFTQAYCLLAYHIGDRLDGAQARRTGYTTPLGRFLDHAMDSLALQCLILPTLQLLVRWEPPVFASIQAAVLLTNFGRHYWQEYYNRVVPVERLWATLVFVGLALIVLLHALRLETTTRQFVYQANVYPLLPVALQGWIRRNQQVLQSLVVGGGAVSAHAFPVSACLAALVMLICFSVLATTLYRVLTKLTGLQALSALSKMAAMVVIAVCPVMFFAQHSLQQLEAESMAHVPLWNSLVWQGAKWVYLVIGLPAMTMMWKMTLFSMGRQSFPLIQPELAGTLAALYWIETEEYLTLSAAISMLKLVAAAQALYAYWWIRNALRKIGKHCNLTLLEPPPTS